MAKTFAFAAVLFLCTTVAFAQHSDVSVPIAEFPRTPPFFFEFHWAGDALYLSGVEALYRFRPGVDETPQEWRRFRNIWELAYVSPDAALIVMNEFDSASARLIIHRETITGENVGQVEIASGAALPVTAISRDGRLAGVLLPDWTVQRIALHLYDLESGVKVWETTIDAREGNLSQLAFSPDAHYLAVYGESHSVTFWDTADGSLGGRFALPDEYEYVRDLVFSHDSQFAYTAGADRLYVLKLQQAGDRQQWTRTTAYPIDADYLHLLMPPARDMLVGIAYQTGEIHIWHVDQASVTLDRVLAVENGGWLVRTPAISDEGRYLATADIDNVIRVWQLD